jgi:hypothetical protein
MPKVYYYDKNTEDGIKTLPAPVTQVVESTPTLTTIKSYLQGPLGVLKPFSILTVNDQSYLDKLNVGEITFQIANIDGGNF